jgi:hypothetical protein
MKILSHFLLLTLLTFYTTHAQDSSLLWKIEHKELSHPSYLYGTIHLICSEQISSSPSVDKALSNVERVVFELDFSDPELPQKMMQLQVNQGDRIENYLSEYEREVLDSYFTENIGAGLSQLGTLKPFALTAMAMQSMIECNQQLHSFEGYLMAKAKQESLAVSGLETPNFQFGLFDRIPAEHQVQELIKGIMSPDSVTTLFDSMVHQYLEEDIESLHQIFVESSTGPWQEELLDTRNRGWIPKLDRWMSDEPIFIAVGAMHLAGENGVIELLRQQGYTLIPVE